MSMQMLDNWLRTNGYWELGWISNTYGDGFVCPCGHEIEQDGQCPEGCVSPMRQAGAI
jgi:hypothetical protein